MLFMIISNQLEKKKNQTQNMTALPVAGTRGMVADPFPPTPTGGTFQKGSRPQGRPADKVRVGLVHSVLPEGPLKCSVSKLWGLLLWCPALVTLQCSQ